MPALPENMQSVFARENSAQRAATITIISHCLIEALTTAPADLTDAEERRLFSAVWDVLPERYREKACSVVNEIAGDVYTESEAK